MLGRRKSGTNWEKFVKEEETGFEYHPLSAIPCTVASEKFGLRKAAQRAVRTINMSLLESKKAVSQFF